MDQPPPMHPNEIDAAYFQMRNDGQFYIPQIGGPPLHIDDWKQRELGRYIDSELEKRRHERDLENLNPYSRS